MLLCYVIDSGLSTSLLLLATLIIIFYIYITLRLAEIGAKKTGRPTRKPVSVSDASDMQYRIFLLSVSGK